MKISKVRMLKVGDKVNMWHRHLDITMEVEITEIETGKSLGLVKGGVDPVAIWGRDAAGGEWAVGNYEFDTALSEVS